MKTANMILSIKHPSSLESFTEDQMSNVSKIVLVGLSTDTFAVVIGEQDFMKMENGSLAQTILKVANDNLLAQYDNVILDVKYSGRNNYAHSKILTISHLMNDYCSQCNNIQVVMSDNSQTVINQILRPPVVAPRQKINTSPKVDENRVYLEDLMGQGQSTQASYSNSPGDLFSQIQMLSNMAHEDVEDDDDDDYQGYGGYGDDEDDDDDEDVDDDVFAELGIFGGFIGFDLGDIGDDDDSYGDGDDDSKGGSGKKLTSKVYREAYKPKRTIKRHGILLYDKEKHMEADKKLIMEFLERFIPGDEDHLKEYRKGLARRWIAAYCMSEKKFAKIHRAYEKAEVEKRLETAASRKLAAKITGRIVNSCWNDPNVK